MNRSSWFECMTASCIIFPAPILKYIHDCFPFASHAELTTGSSFTLQHHFSHYTNHDDTWLIIWVCPWLISYSSLLKYAFTFMNITHNWTHSWFMRLEALWFFHYSINYRPIFPNLSQMIWNIKINNFLLHLGCIPYFGLLYLFEVPNYESMFNLDFPGFRVKSCQKYCNFVGKHCTKLLDS